MLFLAVVCCPCAFFERTVFGNKQFVPNKFEVGRVGSAIQKVCGKEQEGMGVILHVAQI